MELVKLKYFQTIAELQNVTQAANALHIAQPSLSRALCNLEKELGLPLFDRIGKHIYLNENGKTLLRHTEVILRELEDTQRELAERKGQLNQQVSLSMHAGSKLLPELINGFQKLNPNISLQIMQQDIQSDFDKKCDITIYSSIHPANAPNSITLMEEGICLALPVSNPLSRRKSVYLSEVADEPFICLYKGKGLRTVTDEYCRMAGFSPRIVLESDSPSTVRELIAVGVGLAFIPKITWHGMDDDSNVCLVEIEEPHCTRYVNMTWRGQRYVTHSSLLLRNYIIDFFTQKSAEQ